MQSACAQRLDASVRICAAFNDCRALSSGSGIRHPPLRRTPPIHLSHAMPVATPASSTSAADPPALPWPAAVEYVALFLHSFCFFNVTFIETKHARFRCRGSSLISRNHQFAVLPRNITISAQLSISGRARQELNDPHPTSKVGPTAHKPAACHIHCWQRCHSLFFHSTATFAITVFTSAFFTSYGSGQPPLNPNRRQRNGERCGILPDSDDSGGSPTNNTPNSKLKHKNFPSPFVQDPHAGLPAKYMHEIDQRTIASFQNNERSVNDGTRVTNNDEHPSKHSLKLLEVSRSHGMHPSLLTRA